MNDRPNREELLEAVARFLTDDVMAAPAISNSLQQQFGSRFKTSDWTIENESYFRAIRLEKMMMSLLLSLIIGDAVERPWRADHGIRFAGHFFPDHGRNIQQHQWRADTAARCLCR